ncbi:MAG TPA: protein kinase [Myxococcales bacterium]
METRIGRYLVEKLLARGGMAEVFLARADGPAGFSKQVVIKRILPQFIEEERFVKMFLDEARLAALLNHPNIVQVFDFGEEEGSYYLAMEYIEGESIRNIVRHFALYTQAIDPRLAAYLISGACEGLHYAHSLTDPNGVSYNIVHRDISPDNLLVSTAGITKVVDFGIAKAAVNSNRTEAGVLKGKYSYMSPELIGGEGFDRGIDVYALGVVLYELLTGERPFQADNELRLLKLILAGEARPIAELSPGVPPELSQIVAKAMAVDRSERYPDARALQNALDDFLALGRPRLGAVDVAQFVVQVQTSRRSRQSMPASGPKAVPGFPLSGVSKRVGEARRKAESERRPAPEPPGAATEKTEIGPRPDQQVSVETQARAEPAPSKLRRAPPRPSLEEPAEDVDATGRLELATGPLAEGEDLPPVSRRPGWLVPAVVAGAVALVGGIGFLVVSPSGEREPAQQPARPLAETERPVKPAPPPAKAEEPVAKAEEPAPVKAEEPTAKVEEPPAKRPEEPVKSEKVVAGAREPAAKPTPPRRPVVAATTPPSPGLGSLTLRSSPWCDVYVDGAKVGVTPLPKFTLSAGPHKVLLRNENAGIRRELSVSIKAGEETREAAIFSMGSIAVRVQPWAKVALDGKAIGTTPLPPMEVVAGPHEIRLANADLGKDEKRRVTVKEGQQEVVKAIWE